MLAKEAAGVTGQQHSIATDNAPNKKHDAKSRRHNRLENKRKYALPRCDRTRATATNANSK